MSKLKNILNGFYNLSKKDEVVEDLAEQRAKHCVSCVELKEGRLLNLIKDDLVEIKGHYCGLCFCALSAKIRSINESCPLKKW